MKRSCNNCFWRRIGGPSVNCFLKSERPEDNKCEGHIWPCSCNSVAEYESTDEYNINLKLCRDCLIYEFDIEEREVTHYFFRGEHIGTDNTFSEVRENLIEMCDVEIKTLE